jgi:tetratricopeptide (TPR) repeat protein
MSNHRIAYRRALVFAVLAFAFANPFPLPADGGTLSVPPDVERAMDAIYGGDPDAAVPTARNLQRAQPDHPLGYLLEGEAVWWKRYCAACDIKYGLMESWRHGKEPGDEAYLALTDNEINAALGRLAKSETAEMHVYAGMGYALKARVYALRGENRNVARVAVKGRAEMLRALELDPQMADASAVLGIYNYYVDTLSPMVKLLRVFMGIPGGSKEEGVQQLEAGMNRGVLMQVHARFILARVLRQYDQKYEQALSVATPLALRYPHNPIFLLLVGNIDLELGRNAKASEYFHDALQSTVPDPACSSRLREIALTFLASFP